MTTHDPTSLDPRERALAQRLARLGPHGEPSPALDSRILAAAHAAVGGDRRARDLRARRRWPLGLGVAASLALALGLAWQLRPLPDVAPAYRSEADSALRNSPAATAPAPAVAADEVAVGPPPPSEPPASDSVQRSAAAAGMPKTVAARPVAEDKAPATPAPPPIPAPEPAPAPADADAAQAPIVFDAPAPAAAMQEAASAKMQARPATTGHAANAGTKATPAAAAPPQAFGTAPAATSDRAQAPAPAPAPAGERTPAPPAPAAPAQLGRSRLETAMPAPPPPPPAAAAAAAMDGDMPIDDVPPATVASPQVRDAWLARIRELAAAGNAEEARASLQEFRNRYPDYPLPQDLRALLP